MRVNVLLSLALLSLSLSASTPIDKIVFEGNEKIPTKKLNALVQPYLGKTLDASTAERIAGDVESFYRKNNFSLAYASVASIDEKNRTVTVSIKKYADFNRRSIGEMERRPLHKGLINRVFFTGNEKISTYRLMKEIEPLLGTEHNDAALAKLVKTVEDYYRSRRYELAYAEIAQADDNGIVTVAIKKYPSFKARYAREGKN